MHYGYGEAWLWRGSGPAWSNLDLTAFYPELVLRLPVESMWETYPFRQNRQHHVLIYSSTSWRYRQNDGKQYMPLVLLPRAMDGVFMVLMALFCDDLVAVILPSHCFYWDMGLSSVFSYCHFLHWCFRFPSNIPADAISSWLQDASISINFAFLLSILELSWLLLLFPSFLRPGFTSLGSHCLGLLCCFSSVP